MSNLKIIGAQRVKALTTMLEEQEKKAIELARKQTLKQREAEDIVDSEFGVTELRNEFRQLEKRLNELSVELENKTGERFNISKSSNYYSIQHKNYLKRFDEIKDAGTKEKIAEIKKEFADKKNLLWLCETLEEAKSIVGI